MASRVKYVLILLCILSPGVAGQVLQDPQDMEKVRRGVVSIYGCNFEEAYSNLRYIEKKFPGHPIGYLIRGMIMYWEDFPLISGTRQGLQYEECLQKGLELAEAKLKAKPGDAEYLLAALGNAGFLLLYYADNGESGKVISMAPKTYQWVMRSFDYTQTYKDFYFVTGLYNYYREAYANAHPVYKPVMVFFPSGDKILGLRQLKTAADSSIFLMAESTNFLAGIYQSFEKNPVQALSYSRKLKEANEKNMMFRNSYIRDLLVIKKYGEAESLVNGIPYNTLNKYFQGQVDIFRGIIQEKKYNNLKAAEQYYWSGIGKTETYGDFASDYSSYGYFGLSRIYQVAGDARLSRQYRKKAKDLGTFEHINFDR